NTMAEQNVPAQPPTRTDEQIVPRSQWLIIGKSNLLFNAQKIQKNPIFQISVDILSNTNFFRAFTASASIPAIYCDLLRKAISNYSVYPSSNRLELPLRLVTTVIDFVNELGYPELIDSTLDNPVTSSWQMHVRESSLKTNVDHEEADMGRNEFGSHQGKKGEEKVMMLTWNCPIKLAWIQPFCITGSGNYFRRSNDQGHHYQKQLPNCMKFRKGEEVVVTKNRRKLIPDLNLRDTSKKRDPMNTSSTSGSERTKSRKQKLALLLKVKDHDEVDTSTVTSGSPD
ncbi:hypothetical protein Tco_0635078, partial [Tanacetum coccineum]